ncbi:MAG: C10 family peptidase [Bacteroidota bacterium]
MKFFINYLTVFIFILSQGPSFGQKLENSPNQRSTSNITTTHQPFFTPGVAPLLQSRWGQGCLYNAACPVDTASHATCLHVPAGSGAIAMAQLMKFYQYPAHGTGEHGYPHPKYGIQYANFGATNYTWSSMPDSLTSGNDGLANLIYQCGVAQDMNFGSVASTSSDSKIDSGFVKYFSYPSTAVWKSKSDYGAADWVALLKAELDASHPLLYAGNNNLGNPIYFICDGYQTGDLFHFNWGLGGVDNGYYSPDNLTPASSGVLIAQRALFNLAPSVPVPDSYIMNFENVPDFSLTFNDWTVKDVDQHDTYGITGYSFPHQTEPMAFLSFNPAQVTPSMASDQAMQPHSGLRFGACISSNPPSNNDWFISPQIQLGANGIFTFWVKSYNSVYGLDTYVVSVSTTDNNPGSFTTISGAQPLETTTAWTKKTFNLSGYNNQKIYIAINCTSNDHFMMMIDDLEVKPQSSSTLTADFMADKTTPRIGENVNFTDQSSGIPVSWAWKFTGGIPATSSLQNPTGIKYSSTGTYPVSLRVSNGSASDSITKTAYITVSGYPSTMTLDFESVSDFNTTFNPWLVIDVNGGTTYGIQSVSFPHNYLPMAYICFNPALTTPPLSNMVAHSGQKLGCSFSSIPPMNPNNKWLISPKISLGIYPLIELWVRTYNNQFGEEKFNVCVSTTDQNPSSFTPLTTVPEGAPADWTRKAYNIDNYANQEVYFGIQCVTNDGFILMLDDIFITSTVGINEVNSLDHLVIYPNPAKDDLIINGLASFTLPLKIDMISILGNKISSWDEVPESGRVRLDIRKIPHGIYILRITCGLDMVTRKISINN